MDILNFISWIKAGNYRKTLPTDVPNLLAIGSRDVTRDDAWLPLAVNASPLQSLYDKGAVTQITSASTQVTLDTHCGVITTVSLTTAAGASDIFQFYNDQLLTTSVLLVSLEYKGSAGRPIVRTDISNGVTKIIISNTATSGALNGLARIHFMIINS
jgi:hypothetical protein